MPERSSAPALHLTGLVKDRANSRTSLPGFTLGRNSHNSGVTTTAVLPSTSTLETAIIWSPITGDITAGSLWATKPVVVLILRRPGCVLCRYQARELWLGLANPLKRMGVDLVCVVHEWLSEEVKAFKPYWPGLIYLDKEREFFKLMGGGKLLKGNSLPLLNPFSSAWRRIREARKTVKESTMVGSGFIMGGVLVVKAGGEATYMHVEKELGLPAPHDAVMQGARAAAGEDGEEQERGSGCSGSSSGSGSKDPAPQARTSRLSQASPKSHV